MVDFSQMSDDELERNIASASAPAPPPLKDFSSMSDDDLEAAIKGHEAPAQPRVTPVPRPANVPYGRPKLDGSVQNRPAQPVPDMPVDYGMRAAPVDPESDRMDEVMQRPIVRPSIARDAVQSVADFVSPPMELAGKLGLDLPAARAAAQQAGAGNRAMGPDLAAMMSGGLNLSDSVMGFAPGVLRQAGVPMPPVNDQEAFNNLPWVKEMRARAPQQFDQISNITPMVAPQPGMNLIPTKVMVRNSQYLPMMVNSAGREIANTALNSGGINSLLYAAEQFKQGKGVDPMGLGVALGTGAAGGALIHGGAVGAMKAPGFLKGLVGDAVKMFSKLTPEQQRIATEAAAARPSVEQFAQNIGAKNLPEDTQAMVQASRPNVSAMTTQQLEQAIAQHEAKPALQGRIEQTESAPKVAPASGRQVTVNGEQVHLEGDMLQKYEALEAKYKALTDQVKGGTSHLTTNNQEVGSVLKGLGMKFAAEARQLTGKLTAREQLKIAEDAAKIRKGDWVSFKGEPSKVLRGPTYGKVLIDHKGTQMSADYYDVTKIDAPKIPDAVHYSDNAPKVEPITDQGKISERAVMEQKEFPLSSKFFDEQGYGEGWTPNQLTDEELQRTLDHLNYNAKYNSSQRGDPTKIRALVQEKVRREQRKVGGYPVDWKTPEKMDLSAYSEEEIMHMIDTGSEEMQNQAAQELLARHPEAATIDKPGPAQTPLEAKIESAVQAPTPVQAAAAIEQWEENLTGKPSEYLNPVEGDFRRTTTTEYLGRNKNKKAEPLTGHAIFDTPEMQEHVTQLAAAKVQKDYAAERLNKFRRDAFTKFADQDADEFKFPNGAIITKKQVKRSLREDLQHELDAVRDEMATELAPVKSATIESTMTKRFGKGSEDAYVDHARVPDNRTEAGELYKDLYDQAKDAEDHYDSLKPAFIRGEIKRVEALKKPQPEKLEGLKLRLEEVQPMEDLFTEMEKKIQAHTGDVTAAMHVSTTVPHPLGEQFEPLEVGVMFKKGAMEKVVPMGMQDAWLEAKAAIEGRDSNRTPKVQFGSNMRGVKETALAAILGAFSTIKAEAANTTTQVATKHADLLQLWNSTPINEVTAGAILLHGLMPAFAKAVMNEDGKLFKMAFLWNDTMDHFAHGENIAKLVQPPAAQLGLFPTTKRTLQGEYWNTAGQVQQATKGVVFDENLKQQAMNELRSGDVTPLEMINGTKGAAASMKPDQRNALAMWKIGQDHLRGLVEERLQVLRDYQAANPTAAGTSLWSKVKNFSDPLTRTIEAHQYVLDQFDGKGIRGNYLDKASNYLLSNWMDGQFFLNPDFAGTNLTDQLFAVAPAVGSKNLWKANALLIGDAEMRALMHESNLAGGLKVDRVKAAVSAGTRKATMFDKDIESDLVNANAAWVAGAMKYAQNHKPQLAGIGFSGSDEAFVKELLKGKIDPTITMDVWANNAELLSRSLGSDPYQVNTNVMNRSGIAKTLAIFVRQPARVSRLAMHYLATGNFVALYTFLGYTLAVGGRSAIPDDLQGIYGLTNAESAYKAAAAADSFDVWSKVTGNKLTPKVNYSIFWGMSAGANPLANLKEDIGKGANALATGDPKGLMSATSTFAPALKSRVLGLPVGESMRIANSVLTSIKGKHKIYATEFGFRPGGSKDVRLDSWYDKLRYAAEPLIPGKDPAQDAYNQSVNEKFAREHDIMHRFFKGDKVPPSEQFYNRDGGNMLQHGYVNYPDPLADLFGRKK